jgi:hypothetical protein
MDKDSDINAALDTIADFCTQSEEQSDEPFEIEYTDEASETEVTLLKTHLIKWVKLNEFKQKLWYIFRNTLKYGDAFFLRDPETQEWLWMDQFNVEMVRVDEDQGKVPKEYFVRGFDYNREAKFATKKADLGQYRTPFGTATMAGARTMMAPSQGSFGMAGSGRDPRQMRMAMTGNELFVMDAKHVVHLSLSVGMDINWPFGASVLEPIFKTFKQKELLEDSVIIYRVQRAPERRVFYIDVGSMPPAKARAHLDQIKNEIHQRRIPNQTGGGNSMLDAAYNPLSIIEDYFFAQSAEGRGSKVETLQGGDNLGEIGDLTFFTRKMMRGLRVPPSYLGLSGDEAGGGGGAAFNDGKLGAAMIEEFRFSKYCMRLQSLLAPVFDREFKQFLVQNEVDVDPSIYEVKFHPPQNFAKWRQIEIDQAQVGVYQMVEQNRKLSERFKLKRFLNLTEEELLENERMWAEENAAKLKRATGSSDAEGMDQDTNLSSIGIRPPGDDLGMGPGADDIDVGGGDLGGDMNGPGGVGGPGGAPGGGAGGPPPAGGAPGGGSPSPI